MGGTSPLAAIDTKRPLKVAFVTKGELATDLKDPRRWANPHLVSRFIASAIERHGADVRYVSGEVAPRDERWAYRWRKIIRKAQRKKYLVEHHPRSLRSLAKSINEQLKADPPDVVFATSTIPIAQLDCPQPIVYWTDATFAGMHGYYPYYSGLCRHSVRLGNAMEQAALSRATRAIYASHWAARTAKNNYRFDHSKLRVLCRAPNLETQPTQEQVRAWVQARPNDRIELLFVGNELHRKGGDTAIQIAQILHELGHPVRLRLLGQDQSDLPINLPPYIEAVGFVSKATKEGRAKLNQITASSHLLLLPTRAECLSIVPLEASAFGVPTLAYRTGGTPESVKHTVNGYLFEPDAPPQEWAQFIANLIADRKGYQALTQSAYQRYAQEINWQNIGADLFSQIEEAAATAATSDSRRVGALAHDLG